MGFVIVKDSDIVWVRFLSKKNNLFATMKCFYFWSDISLHVFQLFPHRFISSFEHIMKIGYFREDLNGIFTIYVNKSLQLFELLNYRPCICIAPYHDIRLIAE